MALGTRQTRLYVHTVDLYNPTVPTSGTFGPNDVSALTYPSSPTQTAVSCFRETAPEIAKGKFYGRANKEDTVSLLDRVHFEFNVNVVPNSILKFTTTGHPDENQWFLVLGNSMVKNYRANKTVVYVKRVTKPKGVT